MTDVEKCPKCHTGILLLSTRPTGNYVVCNSCDFTEEAKMFFK